MPKTHQLDHSIFECRFSLYSQFHSKSEQSWTFDNIYLILSLYISLSLFQFFRLSFSSALYPVLYIHSVPPQSVARVSTKYKKKNITDYSRKKKKLSQILFIFSAFCFQYCLLCRHCLLFANRQVIVFCVLQRRLRRSCRFGLLVWVNAAAPKDGIAERNRGPSRTTYTLIQTIVVLEQHHILAAKLNGISKCWLVVVHILSSFFWPA